MQDLVILKKIKLILPLVNYFLVVSLPLLIALCIIILILSQNYPFYKPFLELSALYITAAYCVACLLRFYIKKEKFFIWASVFMFILFIREVHPPGSSAGVYIGVFVLLYYAFNRYELFKDYLQNRYLINFLGIGFFTYFLAVTTDQRYWRFIPGEEVFHVPLEESLEVFGHMFIGSGLLFVNKITDRKDSAVVVKKATPAK